MSLTIREVGGGVSVDRVHAGCVSVDLRDDARSWRDSTRGDGHGPAEVRSHDLLTSRPLCQDRFMISSILYESKPIPNNICPWTASIDVCFWHIVYLKISSVFTYVECIYLRALSIITLRVVCCSVSVAVNLVTPFMARTRPQGELCYRETQLMLA